MLVSELITWCNNLYEPDETSDFEISDNKWILFFNEAISEVRSKARIAVTATTDLVEDTSKYALPSNLDTIIEVYISSDGNSYNRLTQFNITNTSDVPTYGYYLWDDEIVLGNVTSDVTDGLLLYYYKTLDEITDTTQTIEIVDPYILGYFALSRIELADRNENEYVLHYNEFQRRLAKINNKQQNSIVQIEEGW